MTSIKLHPFQLKKRNIEIQKQNIPKEGNVLIKEGIPIHLNKVLRSFVRGKNSVFSWSSNVNIFKRYWQPYSLNIPLLVGFKQKEGYIMPDIDYLKIGSRIILLKNGNISDFFDINRGWLGISYIPSQNVPYAEIGLVLEGTPAQKYGLQKGDKILSIDGVDIKRGKQKETLGYQVWSKMPGQLTVLKIARDNNILTKKIKLGYPPINIENNDEWAKIYKQHLLLYKGNRLSIIDTKNAKMVWTFPPNFNFPPPGGAIFDSDEKFIYSVIATPLFLKSADNLDILSKENKFYFAKINLKNLQIAFLKRIFIKGDTKINSISCDQNICYLVAKTRLSVDPPIIRFKIIPINALNGRSGKVFTTTITTNTYNEYDVNDVFYNPVLIGSKNFRCLVDRGFKSPHYWAGDDTFDFLIYSSQDELYSHPQIDCFALDTKKLTIYRIKKDFFTKEIVPLGFNSSSFLYLYKNKLYIYDLDVDKVYFGGYMNLSINEIVLYKALPNGIAILKKGKILNYIEIRYLKNNKIHKKKIIIPTKEEVIGLLSNNKWFLYVTTKNRFKYRICWDDKAIAPKNFICPSCYKKVLFPFFNRKIEKQIKIRIDLFSTKTYNRLFRKKFNIGTKPIYRFTIKPYLLFNKIYIHFIGNLKNKNIIKVYPFTITTN